MIKLYLIAATAIIAASMPALAEENPGTMEEKTEQHGPQIMGEQDSHMMRKPGPNRMGKQGPHMMAKETMWKHMQARNAELDKLVETMNSAQGAEKVDAIAAVVNKLVEIHTEMSERMMQMHKRRMGSPKGGYNKNGMTGGKMMDGEAKTEKEEEQ